MDREHQVSRRIHHFFSRRVLVRHHCFTLCDRVFEQLLNGFYQTVECLILYAFFCFIEEVLQSFLAYLLRLFRFIRFIRRLCQAELCNCFLDRVDHICDFICIRLCLSEQFFRFRDHCCERIPALCCIRILVQASDQAVRIVDCCLEPFNVNFDLCQHYLDLGCGTIVIDCRIVLDTYMLCLNRLELDRLCRSIVRQCSCLDILIVNAVVAYLDRVVRDITVCTALSRRVDNTADRCRLAHLQVDPVRHCGDIPVCMPDRGRAAVQYVGRIRTVMLVA